MTRQADIGGPRPELAWLPVERLSVDPAYQRTLESRRSQWLIEKIAAKFRWSCFQAVLAVKQGGGWVILDGQHRVEAAKRCGVTHVPAVVVSAVSVAEQAAAFVQANLDRVAVNPYALHHARLVAGDEGAELVDRVCKAAGIEIPKYPIPADHLKPGQTLALGTIANLTRLLGEADAAAVLRALAGAFGKVGGGIRAVFIVALGRLHAEQATVAARAARLQRLAAWLRAQQPDDLQAKAVKRKQTYGGTQATNLVELLRRAAAPPNAAEAVRASASSGIAPPSRAALMGRR